MNSDDRQLIRRWLDGDEEACRLLLSRHEGYIYRLCHRFAASREDALDLAQEAMLRVVTGLDGFSINRPLKPWLRQVTVNVCLNWLRRKTPETISLETPIAENIALGDTLPCRNKDPAALVEWREAGEVLREAVGRLPPLYRLVLMLRHEEEMSYEDIATTTELPQGTVKTYLYRGRKKLQQELSVVYGWEAGRK